MTIINIKYKKPERDEILWRVTGIDSTKFIMPVQLYWEPKEDITTFELAQAMPYLVSHVHVMPSDIPKDKETSFMRHFRIEDPNEKSRM